MITVIAFAALALLIQLGSMFFGKKDTNASNSTQDRSTSKKAKEIKAAKPVLAPKPSETPAAGKTPASGESLSA